MPPVYILGMVHSLQKSCTDNGYTYTLDYTAWITRQVDFRVFSYLTWLPSEIRVRAVTSGSRRLLVERALIEETGDYSRFSVQRASLRTWCHPGFPLQGNPSQLMLKQLADLFMSESTPGRGIWLRVEKSYGYFSSMARSSCTNVSRYVTVRCRPVESIAKKAIVPIANGGGSMNPCLTQATPL